MINYTRAVSSTNQGYDEGLRAYMLKIYNYMALALVVTGVSAFATLNIEPLAKLMFQTGFGTLIMFAPLGIAIYFGARFSSLTLQTAQVLFWTYSALMGMSLSCLALVYTGESIVRTFFITASLFGAMSLYGYTTKKDLTSMGSFLMMGLIGLVIASLVNIFLQSPAVYFVTSVIGVGVFIGLIAWDTQKLKAAYYQSGGGEMGQKIAIFGALNLYMDFINLFIYLLRFLGNRR